MPIVGDVLNKVRKPKRDYDCLLSERILNLSYKEPGQRKTVFVTHN